MRVLVATEKTQGKRENDFSHCVEGELVYFSLICANDRFDPDGSCGCGRSFAGLASAGGTTSAMVRELPKFCYADYVTAMEAGMARQGWGDDCGKPMVDAVLEVIEDWPAGTIVERRLEEICVRAVLRQR